MSVGLARSLIRQALQPSARRRDGIRQQGRHGGVDWLRVGSWNLGVNTTFVVYRVGGTWIDAGPANQWGKVLEFAEQQPPTSLLLTHHHEDHSGNACWLRQRFDCRVLAPEIGRGLLREGFPIEFYRRAVWGVPPVLETEPLPWLYRDDGGLDWQAIPTPGHSDDMVCFYQAERGWLFSADLFVASRVRYARQQDRLSLEIASLRRILSLPFDQLFCSHRGPVEDGRQGLARKLEYLEGLRQQVYELWQRGCPPAEIQRRLLGREDGVGYLTGFHFCKANLIEACLQSAICEAANR